MIKEIKEFLLLVFDIIIWMIAVFAFCALIAHCAALVFDYCLDQK